MLELDQLSYQYLEQQQPALQEISARFNAGERIALIGANGAGKSTLCLALSGFIPHFLQGALGGSVRLYGQTSDEASLHDWVKEVGLMLQNPAHQLSGCASRVDEEIAFGLENRGQPTTEVREQVRLMLARTGLSKRAASRPDELSGGQLQRLALASMLILRPSVLVLDEPFAQLDSGSRHQLLPLLEQPHAAGTTLIIAEQDLDFVASWADRVLLLDRGRLSLEGSPRTVLYSDALLHAGLEPPAMVSLGKKAAARGLWPEDLPLPLTLNEACQGLSPLACGVD